MRGICLSGSVACITLPSTSYRRAYVADLPAASRRLEYWISIFCAAREQQRQQLRFQSFNAAWAGIEAAPIAQRPALAASVGLPALAALSQAYDAVGDSLMATLDSYGDLGVLNDHNQQTYSQGVAVAAAQLGTYIPVPPSALPSKAFPGAPRALAPNIQTTLLAGANFALEVWVAAPAVPAAVELCTLVAESRSAIRVGSAQVAPACTAMSQVGSGSVFRVSVPPPAPDFSAWVNVTLGGNAGALYLPVTAPAQPWVISVL